MLALLADVPRFRDGDGHDVDLLFPASGNFKNPMSGDQKVKDRIDKRMRAAMLAGGLPVPDNWCAHDFRRTIATGLQRLGFRPDVADQVIGHVGSTRTGAGAHYLHHKYEAERKEALETWSNHVTSILGGERRIAHATSPTEHPNAEVFTDEDSLEGTLSSKSQIRGKAYAIDLPSAAPTSVL